MDYKKIALYAALVVIGLFLWNKWQFEHPAAVTPVATISNATVANNDNSAVPSVPQANATTATKTAPTANTTSPGKLIWVQTDVLKTAIDLNGGTMAQAYLPQYPAEQYSPNSFQLFNNDPDALYLAQSGLTGKNGPDTQQGQVTYRAAQSSYTLADGQKQLNVDLTYSKGGVDFTKRFTFTRNNYAVQVSYLINNHSAQPWQGNMYLQLVHHGMPPAHYSFLQGASMLSNYTGAAISSPSNHYEKLSFSDMTKQNYSATNNQGWAAIIQHYFLGAWVPDPQQDYHYFTRADDDIYTVGMVGPAVTVAPGKQVTTTAQLYVGPAIADNLNQVAPHLNLTIDYGWLWFISILLFWVLKHVNDFIGNWGWSIIVVTILIKACFYHLSAKSYRSMAHMRRLQPKMEQLRERFADDKAALSKAMMDLYKKEKCNPLGGCLPMLVQIPFFIAFYYMISASVELRQAPFMLWIHDLSVPDPYFILPLIMGATMFLQQRLNPPAPDPMQQKIMMFLPVVFTFIFLNFPAGLVLYWITNNAVSIAQQWWITRQVMKQEGRDHGHSKKR